MSITPTWAAALSDAQLGEQRRKVAEQLRTLPAGDALRLAADHNLTVLVREQERRVQVRSGAQLGPDVPRPTGLPDDGAYRLFPAPDLPAELVAAIPEGQLVALEEGPEVVTADMTLPTPFDLVDTPSDVTEPLAMGAMSGMAHGDRALRAFGFAAAGEEAIGLVAIPRVQPRPWRANFTLPDPSAPLDAWGHTAVFVRRGNTIVIARGFNPESSGVGGLVRLLREGGDIEAGRSALPAVVSADEYLFTHPKAMSMEWPVTADIAERAGTELAPTGPAGLLGHAPEYTARPSVYGGCTGSNCGLWATEQVESLLGGPVGRAGQGPITALGERGANVPRTASQGRLMGMMTEAARSPDVMSPMPAASGPPRTSGMPTKYKVLKVGGRVMVVVGIATDAYEFFTASSAEQPRVAVGIAGGALGGFAAGAAAGLVCGPGAIVCSVLFGVGGALGGRALFQAIFDSFSTAESSSPCIPAYRDLAPVGSGECPNCHRIRRVQECRDEARRQNDAFEMSRRLRTQSSSSGSQVPGEAALTPRTSWGGSELEALVGAAPLLGPASAQPLSPADEAVLRAFLAAD